MAKAASWMTFLLTFLWVGVALAQKPGPNGGGAVTPEPSVLLHALSGILPAWLLLRRK